MVLAGIVLYNPDLERLKEDIESVQDQVDGVLLVDNHSENIEQVKQMLEKHNMKISALIQNKENLALSAATNQTVEYAREHGYDWVLTLNQDSVCSEHLIEHYKIYMDQPGIGAMTCNILDRNFYEDQQFREGEKFRYVETCITSGMLVNVQAYLETGGYDERIIMDFSDFDFCCNLRRHGYKILKINFDGLLHEIGKGRNVRLLWKECIVYNPSPRRHYLMAKNEIYLARKYPEYYSLLRELLRQVLQLILVVGYEREKRKKVAARLKGIKEGLFMPVNNL